MKARKAYLLRLDPKLFDELEAWASADLRSVNAQIEFLLKQAVARRGKKLPMDPAEVGDTNDQDIGS